MTTVNLPTDEQLRAIVAELAKRTTSYTRQFLKWIGGLILVVALSDGAPLEGAFDDERKLIETLNELDLSKKYNLYVSVNELDRDNLPPIAKRGLNQMHVASKGESCTNANIARRRRILVDLDRPEELKRLGPATNEEKEKIYLRARVVKQFLTEHGIGAAPYVLEADSGNGRHLLILVDLPNDDASTSLVKRFLEALALKFNGDGVEIDTKVFDAKRITRAYGSWNRKGTPTKERPHRRSRLFPPDPMFGKEGPVTTQQIEAVITAAITSAPKAEGTATNGAKGPATVADVMAWAKHYGQELVEETPTRWAIKNPACAGRHGSKNPHTTSTRLFLTDGHIGFECHHSSCSKLTFPGYRDIVEKGREPFLFAWESEEAEIEEAQPLVPYPLDVWNGTLYGEYADECSKGNFIPKENHIESLKTVVGAIAGDQLYGDREGMNARQFTVIVQPPGAGKGTAVRWALSMFRLACDDIVDGAGGMNQSFIRPVSSTSSHANVGAVITNAASEPALYEAGMSCRRVLWNPDELDLLVSKTNIQNSGAALLSLLRGLFDSKFVNATTTKHRKAKDVPGVMELSFLTTTQPEAFEELASRGSFERGLMSRLTIVSSNESRTVASLKTPVLRSIAGRLFEKLMDLEKKAFRVTVTPEANHIFEEWWDRTLNNEQHDALRETVIRLNVLVLRNALHLAWLKDSHVVTPEIMSAAIRLGDYQLSQRQAHIGSRADTPVAETQKKIERYLRQHGKTRNRDLRLGVNARRVGTEIFDRSLNGLVKSGVVIEFPGKRIDQKFYALRKETHESQ